MSLFSDSICAVVAAPDTGHLLKQLKVALKQSQTCELRLDYLESSAEMEQALKALPIALQPLKRRIASRKVAIIATLRRTEAGGRYAGSISDQIENLARAAKAGCNWCDLEIETAAQLSPKQLGALRKSGLKLLISCHDFERTPADLRAAVRRLRAIRGINAIKIATECETYADSVRVLETTHRRKDVVAVPMGEFGSAARILALRSGSALAYAPVGQATASGQLSVGEMRDTYRANKLNAQTKVFAIIGNPVSHSLSPVAHNAGYRARRLNAIYLRAPVESLPDFLQSAGAFGFAGFSVTIPLKRAIFPYLTGCDPLAERIGAVNTVFVYQRGQLFGYNTDYLGVVRSLERHMRLAGSRVLIYGAGGAARAAAFGLRDAFARVFISARRDEQAHELARACGAETIAPEDIALTRFDLIVNATPVGTEGRGGSPLAAKQLNCRVVMDMVYRPLETPLLKLARQRRIKTISGLEMFLAQAAAQWEIWWKTPAPINIMRRAALQQLASDRDPQSARDHSRSRPR